MDNNLEEPDTRGEGIINPYLESSTEKVYNYYKNLFIGNPPSDHLSQRDEMDVVQILKNRDRLSRISSLIDLFADENMWFNIYNPSEKPPIGFGPRGMYIKSNFILHNLDKLDVKRFSDQSYIKYLSSMLYSLANDEEDRENVKWGLIDFFKRNVPNVFNSVGGEDGFSEMLSDTNIQNHGPTASAKHILKILSEDAPLYSSILRQYIYDYYLIQAIDGDGYTFPIAKALGWALYDLYVYDTSNKTRGWYTYMRDGTKRPIALYQIELYILTQFASDISSVRGRYHNVYKVVSKNKDISHIIQNSKNRKSIIHDMSLILVD